MTDTRNADLTYGATDFLVYLAARDTVSPTGIADPGVGWTNLGWVTTDGGLLKVAQDTKDIEAAGSLEPIRTLLTKSTKTVQITFLEGLNPLVRALYDNVAVDLLKPTTDIATYSLPDKPNDLRYAFVFDSMDGAKRIRMYMPNGRVTDRGDEQPQTTDVMNVQMTFTFYKGATTSAVKRTIKYGGVDTTSFFPAP